MRCTYIVSLLAISLGLPVALHAEEHLPAALIRVPESVQSIFVAETNTAKFHRFDRSGDSMVHQGAYYMSIGTAGAGKQRSGDRRTPLGVYFVTERLDTSRLHEKYGVMAFPLDYPNAWDKRAQRSGDGIWVHGVDPGGGERPTLDTDGCVALRNSDLMALAPSFSENITPVVVVRDVNWATPHENTELRAELEASVAVWVNAVSSADLHAYSSLYDNDFQRWGLNKAQWSAVSAKAAITQLLSGQVIGEQSMSDLLLLRYPEEEGVYLSRFRLHRAIEVEGRVIETTKRLYWRRNAQGALRVIAEDDG
jgi:L,D-peptidoglycan transpeptidase YkuD (ErfK/YbiS/YcfS/YnhG family)